LRKYQYLLFDLDGTLTDSKPGIISCVRYSLEKMRRPVPQEEKLLQFIGPPLMVSYQEFCGMTEEEAKTATAIYRERYAVTGLFENAVYDGIPQALQSLTAAGYVLAIATSKPEEYLLRILAHFDLEQYFAVVSGSGLDGSRKTKADVIEDVLCQLAVRELGGTPCAENYGGNFYRCAESAIRSSARYQDTLARVRETAIMIGDRHYDIEGAVACSVDSLGIHYGYAQEGELSRAGATCEADTVEDLVAFFV